jgi:hypothetical protein
LTALKSTLYLLTQVAQISPLSPAPFSMLFTSRTRVVGCFPDGNSALMLAAARLRHISGTKWGSRQYMNMKRLEEMSKEEALSDKIFACPSGQAGA